MTTAMPANPHTGLINITPDEVRDARMAEDGVMLVRADGTLTEAGQLYVSDMRTIGHQDCDRCFDPAPDGWEDYALACDAVHAANPHRFEGEL